MLILFKKEKIISCMITISIIVGLFLFANVSKQEKNISTVEAASSVYEENVENTNTEYLNEKME